MFFRKGDTLINTFSSIIFIIPSHSKYYVPSFCVQILNRLLSYGPGVNSFGGGLVVWSIGKKIAIDKLVIIDFQISTRVYLHVQLTAKTDVVVPLFFVD